MGFEAFLTTLSESGPSSEFSVIVELPNSEPTDPPKIYQVDFQIWGSWALFPGPPDQ